MLPTEKLPVGWSEVVSQSQVRTPEAFKREDGPMSLWVTRTEGVSDHVTSWYVCNPDEDKSYFMGTLAPGNFIETAVFMADNWAHHDRILEAGKSLIPEHEANGVPAGWSVSPIDDSAGKEFMYTRRIGNVRIEMTGLMTGTEEGYLWNIYPADGTERITMGYICKGRFRNLAMGLAENWDKPERINAAFSLPVVR